jgi:hypothetical protein
MGEQFAFHQLNPITGEGREVVRTARIPSILRDWALSPDGSQAAIPNHNSRKAEIRLLRLTATEPGAREMTIVLPGLKDLNSVAWSADGRGWYVSAGTRLGSILFLCRSGRPRFEVAGNSRFSFCGPLARWEPYRLSRMDDFK